MADTDTPTNHAVDMLEAADADRVVNGILAGFVADGVAVFTEDEVMRQADIIAEWIVKTEIATVLLDQIRLGDVQAKVGAMGEIVYSLTDKGLTQTG